MCNPNNTIDGITKNQRAKGLAIALIGVLSVSPDALLVRFLSTHGTDPWSIIFWKLLISIPLTTLCAFYEAGGTKKLLQSISRGRKYYFAKVPLQAIVDIGFTLSFVHTSAAEALLLINLNPLWGAIIGRIVLKDVLPTRTYVALAMAMCCMLIMFVPQMVLEEESGTPGKSLALNTIPLLTGFLMAVYLIIVRQAGRDDISLVGGTPMGAAVGAIAGSLLGYDMWKFWVAVNVQGICIGIIFVAMSIAPRYITSPEIGLCTLLEVILGPLFVFLAYRDAPSKWILIGGPLLLIVLMAHESRPLFEKSKEAYKTISKRFSATIEDDVDPQLVDALLA